MRRPACSVPAQRVPMPSPPTKSLATSERMAGLLCFTLTAFDQCFISGLPTFTSNPEYAQSTY